jgi:hypothetical protein
MEGRALTTVFPLRDAYPFANSKGLQSAAEQIRSSTILGRRHPSTVRRAAMIDLFRTHGVLDEFLAAYWPVTGTQTGDAKMRWYTKVWNDYQSGANASGDDVGDDAVGDDGAGDEEQAFALENDLRNYLAGNLNVIAKGLHLYQDAQRDGVEYPVGGKRVDILAVDQNGDFVVIELKVSRGHERTIGQILYYMGWVQTHLAKDKKVRGVIVAKQVSDELKLACKWTPLVELYEYDVQVTLRKT